MARAKRGLKSGGNRAHCRRYEAKTVATKMKMVTPGWMLGPKLAWHPLADVYASAVLKSGSVNRHAFAHGLGDRVSFKEARAKDIKESDFDLVTCFDCLHDMGDPRGCSGHMHRILKADGTWMIVEPIAGNRPEDNMNPVGRLYYNASTMICVPTSLDQEVGEGLVRRRARPSSPRSFATAGLRGFEGRRRGRSTWSLRLGPNRTLGIPRYRPWRS